MYKMSQKKDWSVILWRSYNSLTIIEGNIENRKQKVLVRCVCWKEKRVCLSNILTWSIKSCWCQKSILISKATTRHWLYAGRWLYNIYYSILSRCNNVNNKDYKSYWWRWIMCLRDNFQDFYKDMYEWYTYWLSIDRIDNHWNYCKENCRRADNITQSNNRRNNSLVHYKWKNITVSQSSKITWIKSTTISQRMKTSKDETYVFCKTSHRTWRALEPTE